MPLTKQMANHLSLVLKLREEASRTWGGTERAGATQHRSSLTQASPRTRGRVSPCQRQGGPMLGELKAAREQAALRNRWPLGSG